MADTVHTALQLIGKGTGIVDGLFHDVAAFLELIDRPTKQVMIEARLVESSFNPTQTWGVDWTGVFQGQTIGYGGGPFGVIDQRVVPA